jgi:hypothetical protein
MWLSPFAYQDDETIAWAAQPRFCTAINVPTSRVDPGFWFDLVFPPTTTIEQIDAFLH